MGDDRYPKTVIACLSMLDHYNIKQVLKTRPQCNKPDGEEAVIFAQSATPTQDKIQEGDASTLARLAKSSAKSSLSSSSPILRSKKPPMLQCSSCGKISHASKSCLKLVLEQIHAMTKDPDDVSNSLAEWVIICTTATRAIDQITSSWIARIRLSNL